MKSIDELPHSMKYDCYVFEIVLEELGLKAQDEPYWWYA